MILVIDLSALFTQYQNCDNQSHGISKMDLANIFESKPYAMTPGLYEYKAKYLNLVNSLEAGICLTTSSLPF